MNNKSILNKFEDIYSKMIFSVVARLPLKDRMIFESNSDYSDNSKALFEKVIERQLNLRFEIVWLVDNPENFNNINIPNVFFKKIDQETTFSKIFNRMNLGYMIMRSKYYFFSHRDFSIHTPRDGQVFFNLTHGSSLKDLSKVAVSAEKNSYILSTSDFASSVHEKYFLGGENKRAVLGYPRNDLLFDHMNVLEKLDISTYENESVIIWMPTFRRAPAVDRNDSGASEETLDIPIIKNNQEWEVLNDVLVKGNTVLLIKPHPAQDLKFFKLDGKTNIRLVTNQQLQEKSIELYHLLGESDALITDYSSVYMNYLLLDKPIGFTTDDIEKYTDNLGFVVDNPLDYMPGHKIREFSDMLEFADNFISGKDNFEEERNNISPIFNKFTDGNSSERVLDFLNLK